MALRIKARLRFVRRQIKRAWRHGVITPKKRWKELYQLGWGYWMRAAVVIALGFWAGNQIDSQHYWLEKRYEIYQFQQRLSPRHPYDTRTTVVLIGDEEYWRGELARRVPIKRSYLANLLNAINKSDPAVIALDFDLSSPIPDGSLIENSEYQAETENLLRVIKKIATERTVVLARTLNGSAEQGFGVDADVYDNFSFDGADVRKGYIALNPDLRQLPPPVLELKDHTKLESFAMAIAQAVNPEAVTNIPAKPIFGSYLKSPQITSVFASEVLKAPPGLLRAKIAHRAVIIGASWHRFALGRGQIVDSHPTPAGTMGGAFLHANWVEALLDRRITSAMSDSVAKGIELLAAALVAVVLAMQISPARQIWISIRIGVLIVLMSYFFAQNLGVFFDFFVPAGFLVVHVVLERIFKWWRKAKQFDKVDRRREAAAKRKDDRLAVVEPRGAD